MILFNPDYIPCILFLLLGDVLIFRAVFACWKREQPVSAVKLWMVMEIPELRSFVIWMESEFGKRCWAVKEQNLLDKWKSLLGMCPPQLYFETWVFQACEGLGGASGLVAADSFFPILGSPLDCSGWLWCTWHFFYKIPAETVVLFSPLSLAEKSRKLSFFHP